MTSQASVPVVMAFSGNDPTGGAGIQADIEALASMGCHAAPVITALTVQDTRNVKRYQAVDPGLVVEQARAVLEDLQVACFKIGMLGSIEIASAVHSLLMDYRDVPVVLDPVLIAGGGGALADEDVRDAILTLLVPLASVLVPNSTEARALAPEADTLNACGMALLDRGAELVLITGTHESTPEVVNTLYGNHRVLETFRWERLAGEYHGSGCTLASSTAGLLAQGLEPFSALHEAQEYTWQALRHGYRPGRGQHVPNRLFWAREEEPEE